MVGTRGRASDLAPCITCTTFTCHFSISLFPFAFHFHFSLFTFQKGEFYTVSEMCVDGWYKGQSLRLGKSGVFPGNHVHQVDPGAKSVNFSHFTFVQGTFLMIFKNAESPFHYFVLFHCQCPVSINVEASLSKGVNLSEPIFRQRKQRIPGRRAFRR